MLMPGMSCSLRIAAVLRGIWTPLFSHAALSFSNLVQFDDSKIQMLLESKSGIMEH
jgi:hypothetical protein